MSIEKSCNYVEEYSFDWVNQHTKIVNDEEFSLSCEGCNLTKNRYKNVLANNKSIVPLKSGNYINANYIFGGRYISCQAPLTTTIEDFYDMIWEQETPIIIMLTKYEEKNRIKATRYFSENGIEQKYGKFNIKVGSILYNDLQTIKRMETQIREIIIENQIEKSKRSIIHIHYTGWPDFGVPSNIKQITDMLLISLVCRGKIKGIKLNGPPIIHCSAGLGRSGTFIILLRIYEHHFYSILKGGGELYLNKYNNNKLIDIELEKKINNIKESLNEYEIKKLVAEMVLSIRNERKGMVQSMEQYNFIIQLLNEFYTKIYPFIPIKKSHIIDQIDQFLSPTLKTNLKHFIKPLIKN
ncbi:protein-tyrosine phosphatase, putative [Entamoeba dispar SAW760]|uniref:Protein-tyrosine phosphatase, putative n=1 Tax=Entamoeba dispar (strain ATCC PRA-260 / SAW760) TaxID=370354 RepID=B0EP37_ENTDS|nr:protein-tyrosine phosphatase, putative [Entamoeba dispar SAW760]EDR23712.1 protein-tyrosine phosphatase, putative [Entamoeba dispar SAW760]|eukprot:EDR23712.1 protein-tyrosine phosphatase, putative [Entamoeba dispar SAW760]